MPVYSPNKVVTGASEPASGTTTSTSYTATLSGSPGTNPTVTLLTGTSVRISVASYVTASVANYGWAAVAVSGATTIAAVDDHATGQGGVAALEDWKGRTYVQTGLTPGTNTFTMQYRVNAGTGTFRSRDLVVEVL